MLRIAIPNKGQLSDPAREMLREAGYAAAATSRELVVQDPENDVEFFLRPRDIATYVASGTLDVGITGQDMLADSGANAETVLELSFAPSTFRLAAPAGTVTNVAQANGKRIATSYPGILASWLQEQNINAEIVKLDGAVENAVRLGVADLVADVVATGTTLKQAGLEIVGEPIFRSQAILITRPDFTERNALEVFVRRLQGVIVARNYVLVDYDIENSLIEQACKITPGIESPTISALHDSQWSAVRAMVPRKQVHAIMDELYDLGARGVIVTDIHACRI
ncbi:MAG: ATP phosphoribosyltransferase [Actinobacteria bacterium]|nr:ATP phosphoribosyltransferase [Actinomycetota bacterium]